MSVELCRKCENPQFPYIYYFNMDISLIISLITMFAIHIQKFICVGKILDN